MAREYSFSGCVGGGLSGQSRDPRGVVRGPKTGTNKPFQLEGEMYNVGRFRCKSRQT